METLRSVVVGLTSLVAGVVAAPLNYVDSQAQQWAQPDGFRLVGPGSQTREFVLRVKNQFCNPRQTDPVRLPPAPVPDAPPAPVPDVPPAPVPVPVPVAVDYKRLAAELHANKQLIDTIAKDVAATFVIEVKPVFDTR